MIVVGNFMNASNIRIYFLYIPEKVKKGFIAQFCLLKIDIRAMITTINSY